MKCRAKPYQGQEPFAFFSYCHKDSARVYPLIERLTELGYRIWFDEGISIGDEWPEVIARKLEECTLFLVAMTPDYCHSHNCKNEMTYQVEDRKPMLPLMLENFPLSGGIRLQLATSQYLRLFEQPQEAWASAVAGFGLMAQCKGAPVMLPPREMENPKEPSSERKQVMSLATEGSAARKESPVKPEEEEKEKPLTQSRAETTGEVFTIPNEIQQGSQISDEICAVCIENGKVLFGRNGQVVMTPGQQLPGPVLSICADAFMLISMDRVEKTLQPGELAHTDAGTFLPVWQTEIQTMKKLGVLRFLQADSTGEARKVGQEPLRLGRNSPWRENVLTDHRISRHHADIIPDAETGRDILKDCSRNGVFVNGEKLAGTIELQDGNEIEMGPDIFHYHIVALDFSNEAREKSYDDALALLGHDSVAEDITQAERLFTQLGDFRDSGKLQLRCKEKLEAIRQEGLRQQEALYRQAVLEMERGDYNGAGQKLAQLWDYKDAETLLKKCAELAEAAVDRTVIDRADMPDDGEATVYKKPGVLPKRQLLIVDLATGEVFRGKEQLTVIGRKVNQCDIPFPNNGCMSRRHAELFTLNGEHYVRDCNSSNGTWLDGQLLERGQTIKIEDSAVLNLAGTQLLAAFDARAVWLQKQKNIVYLEDMAAETLIIGGKTPYVFQVEDPDATVINGHSALRGRADFWQEAGTAWLKSRDKGDVLLNGRIQEPGEPIELKDGDEVRIADADYCFRSIRLISLQKA